MLATRYLTRILSPVVWCSLLSTAATGICETPRDRSAELADEYALKYREVQQAILVFKQGRHSDAREILADATSRHAELPPVDVMMARLYLSANEVGKAESILERVVAAEPDDPEAFVILGDLAVRNRRFAYAELAYHRADTILQDYNAIPARKRNLQVRVLAGLASLCESRRQYDMAAAHLDSWLELDPEHPLAIGSLGRVSFLSNDHAAARAAFAKLSGLVRTAPPPEIAMGRLFSDAGMFEKAQIEMQSALDKYPQDARVLLTVAEWSLNNGLNALAAETVASALAVDDRSVPARVISARLARYAGDLNQAESLLVDVLPLAPNSFLLADELARTLITFKDEKRRQAALQHAERNYHKLQKTKSSMALQATVTYAWVLFGTGEVTKAEAVVQSLPNRSVISNENAYYVASIYAGRGRKEMAVNMLKALVAEDRPFPLRKRAEELLAELMGQG